MRRWLWLSMFAAFVSLRALAGAHTWSGAVDGAWSNAMNWSVGGAPTAAESQPVDLTFPSGATTLVVSNDIASLTIHGITISGNGYTLGGMPISLAGNVAFSGVAGSAGVALDLALSNATHIFSVADAGSVLTLSGTLTGTAGGSGVQKSGQGTLTVAGPIGYDHQTQVSGGILNAANDQALGPSASSNTILFVGTSLQVQGNTGLTIPANMFLMGSGVAGTGTVVVSSSTTSLTGTLGFVGPVSFATGPGARLTLSGTAAGSGSLTKIGTGTLVINGTASYTGATNVNAGTVLVDSALSASATAVGGGGTLGGKGTTQGVSVSTNGTVAPGHSPGILGTGNVSFAVGSTFAVELNGPNAGTDYDQLAVTGTVTLGGALSVVVTGFAPAAGATFTILDNDGADAVTGTFSGLAEGAIVSAAGGMFSISYVGGTGNDVVLTAVCAGVDAVPPVVTAPADVFVTQTLCQ